MKKNLLKSLLVAGTIFASPMCEGNTESAKVEKNEVATADDSSVSEDENLTSLAVGIKSDMNGMYSKSGSKDGNFDLYSKKSKFNVSLKHSFLTLFFETQFALNARDKKMNNDINITNFYAMLSFPYLNLKAGRFNPADLFYGVSKDIRSLDTDPFSTDARFSVYETKISGVELSANTNDFSGDNMYLYTLSLGASAHSDAIASGHKAPLYASIRGTDYLNDSFSVDFAAFFMTVLADKGKDNLNNLRLALNLGYEGAYLYFSYLNNLKSLKKDMDSYSFVLSFDPSRNDANGLPVIANFVWKIDSMDTKADRTHILGGSIGYALSKHFQAALCFYSVVSGKDAKKDKPFIVGLRLDANALYSSTAA